MLTDRYGLAVSTSSAAARDAYVAGCDLLFQGNAGPVEAFQAAIDADPGFALAHAGKARALQLKGDAAASRAAMAEANAAGTGASEREKSHIAYYSLVNAGQLEPAVAAAREHLKHWPRDAMVLSPCTSVFGLIGFSGRKGREREQVEILDWLAPAYGDDWWFCAQHAFALDEVGQRSAARRKIERVMVQTPRNAHAAHILAHVMYEDGAMDAARRFLAAWLPGYERAAILHCHVSWHLALCELEAGHGDAAFAIFDDAIDPAATDCPPINVLTDAAAFLWRAELAGGRREMARWRRVHEFAHRHFPRAGIAFSDTHVLLADAVCGDGAGFAQRLSEIDERIAQGRQPSGPVVPALARGFAAFVAEDWNAAIAAIEPVMGEHERIGGSRAQRDLVEFTLLRAYLNAGREADARRYLNHRREGACRAMVAGVARLG